jgi:hypothetical protein
MQAFVPGLPQFGVPKFAMTLLLEVEREEIEDTWFLVQVGKGDKFGTV